MDPEFEQELQKLPFHERIELRRKIKENGGNMPLTSNKGLAPYIQKRKMQRKNKESNRKPTAPSTNLSREEIFNLRIEKRRAVQKICRDPEISEYVKEDLLENKETYISDMNCIIEDDGKVVFANGGTCQKRLHYEPVPEAKAALKDRSSLDSRKAFSSLVQDKSSRKSVFPVVYVEWLEEHQRFNGREFNEIFMLKRSFSSQEFKHIHKKLFDSPYYTPTLEFGGLNLMILLLTLSAIAAAIVILFTLKRGRGRLIASWITLGVYLVLLVLLCICKARAKTMFFEKREEDFQHILKQKEMKKYLGQRRCEVQVGPYGSFLRFVFTHVVEPPSKKRGKNNRTGDQSTALKKDLGTSKEDTSLFIKNSKHVKLEPMQINVKGKKGGSENQESEFKMIDADEENGENFDEGTENQMEIEE